MNQYKYVGQCQALKITCFTLLMAFICCLVALNEVRKENNKSKQFIALLQVHATDFSVAWSQVMQEFPQLTYDEVLALSRERSKNVSRDEYDQGYYDEGNHDM